MCFSRCLHQTRPWLREKTLQVVAFVVLLEVGLQVRKGTGFVPVSDLPSDDEEEDEQVGGPFGNNSNLSVGSEFKVTFARCAFTLLLGKTPGCLTVSFFCYTFALHAQGPKGVSFDASSQACCDGKSPGIKSFAFIGNKIKWFVWLGLGPIDCLHHA